VGHRSIRAGAAFGVVELVYKPIQYHIHERVWYKWIKYGLKNDKTQIFIEINNKNTT